MNTLTKELPKAEGNFLLGNAMDLSKDPVGFVLKEYESKGPVFEARVLNKKIYFAAGLEANIFFSKHINEYLTAKEIWRGYAENYGADINNFLLAMEGIPHAKQRKVLMRGFSPRMLQDRHQLVSKVMTEFLEERLGDENSEQVVRFVQRMIMEQLGMMCANTRPGEYYEDLLIHIRGLLNVHILKMWPKAVLKLPKYRKARKRCQEFSDIILDAHLERNETEHPDLIDDILQANKDGTIDLTRDDLRTLATSPFSSGMDTISNTFAMALYILAKDQTLKERVQGEIDEKFIIGTSDVETLKEMPLVHALFMEILRMYPVSPYIPRTVSKDFEYLGYHFKQGRTFYVAQAVTHFMEDLFPNPHQFDIDRFLPPREEHKQRGALSPYGLGAHKCVGLRLGEFQMMYSLCHLMKLYNWELNPKDYKLKTRVLPTIGPEPKFTLKFKRR